MLRKFAGRLLAALAFSAAAAALSPTAESQQAGSAPAQTPEAPIASNADQTAAGKALEKVTVTGYILPHVGDGPQPVTNYNQDYISKSGYQTTTDVLQTLPGAEGNFNPGATTGFGFSPGSASISLKGLPPTDTLVLVDGLRFPAFPFPQVYGGTGPLSFVDLNSIPVSAIDHIEILNDGGSATYGSDAVAGVVNIILKDQYTGAEITNYYGISQRGDDEVYHGSAVGGCSLKLSDTSKVSVVAGIDFYSSSPIMQLDRPFTNLNSQGFSPNYRGHEIFPTYRGTFSDAAENVYQVNPGSSPPIMATNFTVNGPPDLEYNDRWYQLLPRETRIGGFFKLDCDPTPWLKLYDSLIVDRSEELSSFENQGIYPPAPFNHGGVTVPANNPYNPFGIPLTIIDMSLNEFGPLQEDATITTLRNVVGATVQLPFGWFVDGSFTYGESDGTETQNTGFLQQGVQEALDGTLPGHVGQFFNPFVDESLGLKTNAAFYNDKQVVTGIWQDNRTDLADWNLRFGGPIAHLDNGDLNGAGLLEYRSEVFIQNEDQYSKSGEVLDYENTVGKLTSGRRYEKSLAGELDIPIFGNKWSFPGLRTLDAVISYRWDDYNDFGNAEKPKFAFRWKPFNDLTFRATYSEGFVAPSLSQLFGSPLPAEAGIIDPKNPQLGEYITILSTVGNPNLKPETSYGYNVGGVWSPGSADPENSWWRWANGFSAYLNWFQIDKHNLIGSLGAQGVVDLATPPPGNFVVRNPVTSQITDITTTYLNSGNGRAEGIEFGLIYEMKEFSWGKLELSLNAEYNYHNSVKTITGLNANESLQYSVQNGTDTFSFPDFKLLATIFYSKKLGLDTFKTGFTLHYTDSEADANNSANGTNPNFVSDVAGTSYVHLVGSWTTLDWQISYEIGLPATVTAEMPRPGYAKDGKRIVGEDAISPKPEGSSWGLRNLLANTTLTFGINNIFDTRPPLSADWYQTYDYGVDNFVMRYFYVQVDKKF
jgi:iron complex outermembrane recepter protein